MSRKMPPIEENLFLTLFLSSACFFFGGGGRRCVGQTHIISGVKKKDDL